MFFFISLQAVPLSGQYCRLPTAQEPIKMLQFTDGPLCHMIMCTICAMENLESYGTSFLENSVLVVESHGKFGFYSRNIFLH